LATAQWTLSDVGDCEMRSVQIHWRLLYKENGRTSVQHLKKTLTNFQVPPIPTEPCPRWQFVSKKPKSVEGVAVAFKGYLRMEEGQIFQKISAPHSLMKIYQMNLISARLISLDSTFKVTNY
jgi:hypothetical protein